MDCCGEVLAPENVTGMICHEFEANVIVSQKWQGSAFKVLVFRSLFLYS